MSKKVPTEVPDPTFLSLNPREITFPPFDRTVFARGDQRNSLSALSIDKYVSKDRLGHAVEYSVESHGREMRESRLHHLP